MFGEIFEEKLIPLGVVFKCSNNQKTLNKRTSLMVSRTKFHGYTYPFFIKSAKIFFENFIPECIVPMGIFIASRLVKM